MNTSSKVIFLDIDGPLLSHRARQHPRNQPGHKASPLPEPIDWAEIKAPEGSEAIRYFDELAVNLTLELLVGHGAKLVASSSWKKVGLANMKYILGENGISGSYLHTFWKTEFLDFSATRAQEIAAWLNAAAQRNETIEAYAALDDDLSVTTLPGGVLVPYADGMRWSDFCSASAALGGGFEISNSERKSGKLTGDLIKGPLGETVVIAHGLRTSRVEFDLCDDDGGPAPPECLRLRRSEYQLVRLARITPESS